MFWKKKKAKAELVSVETEEEFHAALDRGADVELTQELAEKVGLMEEDVGTLEDRGHLTKRKKSYANGAVLKLVAFRFPPASPID